MAHSAGRTPTTRTYASFSPSSRSPVDATAQSTRNTVAIFPIGISLRQYFHEGWLKPGSVVARGLPLTRNSRSIGRISGNETVLKLPGFALRVFPVMGSADRSPVSQDLLDNGGTVTITCFALVGSTRGWCLARAWRARFAREMPVVGAISNLGPVAARKDAGIPVKYPQCWGYPEWLHPFNLHAYISVAGSWAPAASRCRVVAGHQRTNGGFLATKPMGIGRAERARAKARP